MSDVTWVGGAGTRISRLLFLAAGGEKMKGENLRIYEAILVTAVGKA